LRPTSVPNGMTWTADYTDADKACGTQAKHVPVNFESGVSYCAPFRGEAGFLSKRMWLGPRPTPACMASFILIHPAVWRYRQTGQETDSIGRTVLQTVPKIGLDVNKGPM